ncbi:MAG: 3-deoxy-manno-octulosonate cytidylyltransferase [Bacteroidales bacterium]|nr:3-deoxy-manno-octulosonate cytidylyltransferase [Bacteroidales bacterium]
MRKLAVIPARYGSSRFEGKPLALINSEPMIVWVYRAVEGSQLFDKTVIATDDERIFDAASTYGAEVLMTSSELSCGTQRCKAALELLEQRGETYGITVNIQGDEPLIKKEQMERVLEGFSDENTDIVTLAKRIEREEEFVDTNVVKAVFARNGKALYFSRSPIPYGRQTGGFNAEAFKHIGIYAFRSDVLKKLCLLKESRLERTEKLEQLAWLENGFNIMVKQTDIDSVGVDTPADLENVIKLINNIQ